MSETALPPDPRDGELQFMQEQEQYWRKALTEILTDFGSERLINWVICMLVNRDAAERWTGMTAGRVKAEHLDPLIAALNEIHRGTPGVTMLEDTPKTLSLADAERIKHAVLDGTSGLSKSPIEYAKELISAFAHIDAITSAGSASVPDGTDRASDAGFRPAAEAFSQRHGQAE